MRDHRVRDHWVDHDGRVPAKTLFAVAVVIMAFGALALWGPWADLQQEIRSANTATVSTATVALAH